MKEADVRCWHLADINTAITDVRYGGKADLTQPQA